MRVHLAWDHFLLVSLPQPLGFLIPVYLGKYSNQLKIFSAYFRGAINPARDLGPRIFLSFILGAEPFLTNESFWWIPIVGPLLGGIISSIVYFTFIEAHWPVANLDSLSPDVNTKKDEAEL